MDKSFWDMRDEMINILFSCHSGVITMLEPESTIIFFWIPAAKHDAGMTVVVMLSKAKHPGLYFFLLYPGFFVALRMTSVLFRMTFF
ncbi:MAG: hypothetical protein WCG25_02480 [bacterium]